MQAIAYTPSTILDDLLGNELPVSHMLFLLEMWSIISTIQWKIRDCGKVYAEGIKTI